MISRLTYLAADPENLGQGVVELDSVIKEDIEKLLGYAAGIVFVLCVAKVIFVGARLAWDHKHGAGIESPTAAEFIAANVGAILAGGVSITVATLLLATAHGPQATAPQRQGNLVEQIEQMPKPQFQQNEEPQENE